jgi:hypothetical protein
MAHVSANRRAIENSSKESLMDADTSTSLVEQGDLVDELREHRPDHPALARLRQRMVNSEEQQITSYNRMHHRHNRS